jgi:hypothetical protein
VELPDLDPYRDIELLALWSAVMRKLHDRGVIRSSNNPVGDYCEGLVAAHFDVDVQPPSTKGYDVLASGVRYQVKGRRTTPRSKPSHYSPIRDLEDRQFDYVIAVHLDEDFAVSASYLVTWEAVKRLSQPSAHLRGVRLPFIRGARVHEDGVSEINLKLPVA